MTSKQIKILYILNICLIMTLPASKIYSQSEYDKTNQILFLKTFGMSFDGGANYFMSDYGIKKIGYEAGVSFQYLAPIKTKLISLGIKSSVSYGLLRSRAEIVNKEIKVPYYNISGGIVFYYNLSEGFSISTYLPLGEIIFNPQDYQGNLLPNNNSGVYKKNKFAFSPQLSFNFWLSPTVSFDVSTKYIMPFSDYLDDFAEDSWDYYLSGTLGFSFFLTHSYDSDNDGIADDYDICKNTPPDEIEGIDEFGCGISERDSDEDGVFDKFDKCPNTPNSERLLADSIFGCGPSERDTDNDGVNDNIDRCPNTPASEREMVDENGCSPSERDGDNDGIYDNQDECPETPLYDSKFVNSTGCGRSERDTDGDGIVDLYDLCQDNGEVFNFFMDEDGCTDSVDYDLQLKLNEIKPLFAEGTTTLSSIGQSILKGQPLLLIQSYPSTIWTIEIKAPSDAEAKAIKIKIFLDELIGNSNRTNIKSSSAEVEEIFIYLDKESAKKIAIENQNKQLLIKKEEK